MKRDVITVQSDVVKTQELTFRIYQKKYEIVIPQLLHNRIGQ
jgi:hypothetical protein